MSMKCRFALILVSAASLLPLAWAPLAYADNMTSSTYRLWFGTLNITSGNKTSSTYRLTDTVGQTAPGQYGLTNNIVKAGFQYIYPLETFTFKISSQAINFGSLTIGEFATAQQMFEVTAIGAGGYTVKAYEDHPLKQTNGVAIIPDTTCDTSCSESTAGVWTDTSKFGFGYNMSGHDVPAAFTDSTYFKQFADMSNTESAQTIMSSTSVGTKRHATITYKLNISATQQTGNYETQIVYIAIPGY